MTEWKNACIMDDLQADSGACVLVDGHQIALFYMPKDNAIYALNNYDPFGCANVLSRGIIGDISNQPVVSSPLHKQHFNLITGICLEDEAVTIPIYPIRINQGNIQVSITKSTAKPILTTDKPIINSTCPYCGVGCGITAVVSKKNHQVDILGDKLHPANFGRLCSKGAALGKTIELKGRLLQPTVNGHKTDWPVALNLVANTFITIIEKYGPDAIAIYGSGQLLTEDYYVANKLMKGFIGSANFDTNSRLCMSSSVAGHKRAFGSDTVPGCYDDFEKAEMIVLIGSNAAWCHPVIFQRIQAAKLTNPVLKIVVIDPRRTSTCDIADLHLPIASGSDAILFNGLLHFLHQQKTLNKSYIDSHTEGFSEALNAASNYSTKVSGLKNRVNILINI